MGAHRTHNQCKTYLQVDHQTDSKNTITSELKLASVKGHEKT